MREAYARGQAAEDAGKAADALRYYVAAQAFLCGENPVETDAARRAAPLALALGSAAEKAGDFAAAQRLYDQGGHLAAADRALLANVRAHPDDPALVAAGLEHFDERAGAASEYQVRLAVTGEYARDPRLHAELKAAPVQGVTRALQREAAAFDARYLADRVEYDQSKPDEAFDPAVMQGVIDRARAFETKWPEDPLARSRAELWLAREWTAIERDPAAAAKLEARRVQRQRERSATLAERYAGSPTLLEKALEYERESASDAAEVEPQLKRIRAQAVALGDAATAKGRLNLAADYYSAADEREKAQAARERMNQLATQRMQPQIDRANAEAEKMRAFNDPARVEAMRKQAEAAKKAIEANKKDPAAAAKSADELEDELGM